MALPTPSVPAIAGTTLDNVYKIVQGDKEYALVEFGPDPLYDGLKFLSQKKTGSQFQDEIQVSHGGTARYLGTQDYASVTYPTTTKHGVRIAVAFGSHYYNASEIYTFREQTNMGSEDQSYTNMQNMFKSFMTKAKMQVVADLLYAASDTGLGIFTGSANINATSTTITMLTTNGSSQFAPGLVKDLAGALEIDLCKVATNTTAVNVNGPLNVDSVSQWGSTVTWVVSGLAADITLVDAAFSSPSNCVARFYGQAGKDIPWGIDKLADKGAGTSYLGVTLGTYPRWDVFAPIDLAGTELTFDKVTNGLQKLRISGHTEGKVSLLMSAATWKTISNQLTAIRAGATPYNNAGSFVTGAGEVQVFFDPTLNCNYVIHPFIKESEAFLICLKMWNRRGSYPLVNNPPGLFGGAASNVMVITSTTATELRLTAHNDCAPVTYYPLSVIKFKGILNPT
jgi:hypothetical protein